ncbi:sodium-dependent transporter [Streptomyces sp. TRM70350]|uniref:sodium-dependent transporter n=1 Tax=Streptomyces sp. TRM70350 TaxID=2856165 RepID=UPI001C496335|nr:sodium-dependent transporter [Streptomyces sp. TRM70350]MBV7699831.1 sodium-dependent transporter [Streptomyces sp. TRM70350]
MARQTSGAKREVFSSRFAFVAAAIGMAVGTGNIWRFPRDVGAGGGGVFIIALVLANLVWAVPLLMAESLLGSRSRLGTIGAFREFMGRRFAWMGGFMAVVTVGILFYYTVICGWAIRYFVYAVSGKFSSGVGREQTQGLWDGFVASPAQTILFHVIAAFLVGFVVIRGLKGGLEAVLKVTVPVLFVVLVLLAVRAMTLSGAGEGLRYLFVPDWSRMLDGEMWLGAFVQMAFSTGAGWGLYLTYSVYMRKKEDFALNAGIVVAGNHLASLLAGIAVICTVFAVQSPQYAQEAVSAGDQGLMFVYLAALFGQMPGGTWIFAPLFFLVLVLAGLSSLIAMMELAVRNVMDFGVQRRTAVLAIVLVTLVGGIPSALDLDVLTNQDNVWGVGLLISGLFAAIAMMRYGLERARRALDLSSDFKVGSWWKVLIGLFPLMFAVVFGWFMYLSVTDESQTWYDPLQTFSIGTMVLQWTLVLVVMLLLNDLFSRKIRRSPLTAVDGEQPPAHKEEEV